MASNCQDAARCLVTSSSLGQCACVCICEGIFLKQHTFVIGQDLSTCEGVRERMTSTSGSGDSKRRLDPCLPGNSQYFVKKYQRSDGVNQGLTGAWGDRGSSFTNLHTNAL